MNNNLLTEAIIIATSAHNGQFDKCGEPYILHPMRVMLSVISVKERIIAILHDVVEDTDITIETLKKTFPLDIIEAIASITHKRSESYIEYLERCCKNPLAINIKRADISDNNSPIRLYKLDLETRTRLREKYVRAINYIDKIERYGI